MSYSSSLSFNCPYCQTKTQFISNVDQISFCKSGDRFHNKFQCTHCGGLVIVIWPNMVGGDVNRFKVSTVNMEKYYPIVGDFKPQINMTKIFNENVRKDYKEAIDCYNNGFYNASMVMTRRAIHQEMDINDIKEDNLYDKIQSLAISENLKKLLNKVKNFGNSGAHPDFFLYDDSGNKLIPQENEREFAKLSLVFLDKYFQDQYEI